MWLAEVLLPAIDAPMVLLTPSFDRLLPPELDAALDTELDEVFPTCERLSFWLVVVFVPVTGPDVAELWFWLVEILPSALLDVLGLIVGLIVPVVVLVLF